MGGVFYKMHALAVASPAHPRIPRPPTRHGQWPARHPPDHGKDRRAEFHRRPTRRQRTTLAPTG